MKYSWRGSVALLISAAIYGSYGSLIKLLGRELNVPSQIVLRYALAVILLAGLVVGTKVRFKFQRKTVPMLVLFGVLIQAGIWCFTQGALLTTIPSLLGAFYIGSIISGAVIGVLIFRERLSGKSMVATTIAIGGLYWLTKDATSDVGVLYGLVAGLLECTTHSIRKYLSKVSRGMMALVAMLGTLVFTLVSAEISHQPLVWPTQTQTWLVGMVFATLATLVNMTLTYGFRSTPIAWGSILMATEIVFGSLMGWWWLGTAPTSTEWTNNLLILLAIISQNMPVLHNKKVLTFIRNTLEG